MAFEWGKVDVRVLLLPLFLLKVLGGFLGLVHFAYVHFIGMIGIGLALVMSGWLRWCIVRTNTHSCRYRIALSILEVLLLYTKLYTGRLASPNPVALLSDTGINIGLRQ